nr:hypothetical protein [uncultured Blautia sp.]
MENLFENLELEQMEQFLSVAVELKYFSLTQWKAIHGLSPMSQELFDGIQLLRLKVGEELESVALDIFLKYPVFASNYSDRLENVVKVQDRDTDDMEIDTAALYEKMRNSIYTEFQYDIGA